MVRSIWTTTIIRRIADGFSAIYQNSNIKKYEKTSPLFATLPLEVSHVLLHKFADFLDHDFKIITLHDPLNQNQGLKLFSAENKDEIENNDLDEELQNLESKFVQNNAVDNDYDSDSSEDEENVLPLRSGKKRVTFSKT